MSPDDKKTIPPPQSQTRPGYTKPMDPHPRDEMASWRGRDLLKDKVAIVTGGDSGIGRAVSIGMAKEGADIAIAYLEEEEDAQHSANLINKAGRKALLLPGDLTQESHCLDVVSKTLQHFAKIDILVNNIAFQQPCENFEDITTQQWDTTFKTNIYSYFWMTKAVLSHMKPGSCIINTSSINGLRGNKSLIDYSATKGAINALTYSLAQALVDRGIRVNAVAPGPVWTPLIPSTFSEEKVEHFGQNPPMGRPAHPDEIAPSYIFFAADSLSSYYSGEILSPIGGETLPG